MSPAEPAGMTKLVNLLKHYEWLTLDEIEQEVLRNFCTMSV